jgi:hypothetical protein
MRPEFKPQYHKIYIKQMDGYVVPRPQSSWGAPFLRVSSKAILMQRSQVSSQQTQVPWVCCSDEWGWEQEAILFFLQFSREGEH